MGYYYNDDEDEFDKANRSFSLPVVLTIAGVSVAILVILLVVLASNKTSSGKNNLKNTQMMNSTEETAQTTSEGDDYSYEGKDYETLYADNKLRAEDLDIWDMYDHDRLYSDTAGEDGSSGDGSSGNGETPLNPDDPNASPKPDGSPSPEMSPSPSPSPENTLIEGVKENSLIYSNLQIVDNKMSYSYNGVKISHLGVMISADSGIVDFSTLKSNGVDFVMIKVGGRGYESGVMDLDANFLQNIKAANDEGLDVGVYFCSRAITETEAREEADYVVSQIREYKVKYPVAYVFEGQRMDKSRTDDISPEDMTKLADEFLTEIKLQGYDPVFYGSEDMILNTFEPEKLLKRYDVFLNDQSLVSEYPYEFMMWRYSANQVIPGVEKTADYVISFVDYSGR